MDDSRIWEFEEDLWAGGREVYERKVAPNCLMALPARPYLFDGPEAIAAVQDTPRWESASFADKRVERPAEGLIVIAYRVLAKRGGETYHALCSSTLLRVGHEDWRVVQHQQTPFGQPVAPPD